MTQLFRSSVMRVRPEWIDYNGHLNMAYYSVLFDEGADQVFEQLGFGPDYRTQSGHTTYSAEFHISYLRELHLDAPVTVTFQMIDCDEKRFHSYQELWHTDGWLAATAETMTLHVDQSGPRVAPMPPDIFQRVDAMRDAHNALPRPARVGASIGIKRSR